MITDPIVFFDSGIGGLPYLQLAQKKLPNESFVFLADKENFPYGEKSTEQIQQAVYNAIEKAVTRFSPKMFVIACNTASVVALKGLRERFPHPFIGVVPAVKPAASLSKSKKVGVVATRKTTEDGYLKDLVEKFARDCKVIHIPAGQIVNFVENDIFLVSNEKKLEIVYNTIQPLIEEQVDAVVLACTHFLHLEKEFKQLFGVHVNIVDSREGVINQLIRVLDQQNLKSMRKQKEDVFYITGNKLPDESYIKFANQFNLNFFGTI
jgi:glutamate racemase